MKRILIALTLCISVSCNKKDKIVNEIQQKQKDSEMIQRKIDSLGSIVVDASKIADSNTIHDWLMAVLLKKNMEVDR